MNFFIPLPVRVPAFVKWWHPKGYIWDKPTKEKVLYLTFDDGPIPEVTEWVLGTLSRKRNPDNSPILATFFCIGDNVRKHPEVFKKVLEEEHTVGNHTFNHLKGWLTENDTYLKNTHLAELEMSKLVNKGPQSPHFPLFRPPYGKIKKKQATDLKKQGYEIIMYRTVAYDWDANTSPEKCLENVIENSKSGDIIVFHDSVKSFENMKYALPKMIDHFLEKGYRFEKL
jgi:peptidoglycan/xylan/chitin deacetylase (PgdA/CDA1 family)